MDARLYWVGASVNEYYAFLDALASLDFKLSLSQLVTFSDFQ